jgi:Zn-dependent hydrolases, including glyoxylases
MKKKLIAAVSAAFIFSALSQGFAQGNPDPKMYKIGDAEVWAIADFTGERALDIFEGVDAKTLKKYIPSGKAPSAVMTYLIKNGGETIIVDTGFGKGLMDGLEKLNIKQEEVTLVLITHMHGDHIGGLLKDEKVVFSNAKVKIGKIERDFWTDDSSEQQFPARKANFDAAKKVVSVYGDSVEVFDYNDIVTENIKALDASGHTPGQAAFLLESQGEKLLFIADVVHVEALQFPRTDISSRYDMDPKQSAEARERIFSVAAKEKIPVAGAHLIFPGIGKIKKHKKEGYIFVPEK